MVVPRHVVEEGECHGEVAPASVAERGEDGIVGNGIADTRECAEHGAYASMPILDSSPGRVSEFSTLTMLSLADTKS